MKAFIKAFLLINAWLCGGTLWAHPAGPGDEPPAGSRATLLGISILGSPSIRFSTANDYANGVSVDHATLQLNVSLGLNWSLQVRATDDLRYQTQSIPISSIGVQSISLGSRPEIFLKTTDQLLGSGFATSLLNVVMVIRYRAVGGANFLKPAGNYTTTLVFTYSAL